MLFKQLKKITLERLYIISSDKHISFLLVKNSNNILFSQTTCGKKFVNCYKTLINIYLLGLKIKLLLVKLHIVNPLIFFNTKLNGNLKIFLKALF